MASKQAVAKLVSMLATAFGEIIERKFPSEEWYAFLHNQLRDFGDSVLARAATNMLAFRRTVWENENAFAIILEECTKADREIRQEARELEDHERKRLDDAERHRLMDPEYRQKCLEHVRSIRLAIGGETMSVEGLLKAADRDDVRRRTRRLPDPEYDAPPLLTESTDGEDEP